MGRRVITPKDEQEYLKRVKTQGLEQAGPPEKKDDYSDRLLKYIPGEIVAAFVAINGALQSAASLPMVVNWIVFVVLAVITPLYVWRISTQKGKQAAKSQIAVSTFSFVLWVFAVGGPFANLAWWLPVYGTVVLPIYTLLVPLFVGAASNQQTQ